MAADLLHLIQGQCDTHTPGTLVLACGAQDIELKTCSLNCIWKCTYTQCKWHNTACDMSSVTYAAQQSDSNIFQELKFMDGLQRPHRACYSSPNKISPVCWSGLRPFWFLKQHVPCCSLPMTCHSLLLLLSDVLTQPSIFFSSLCPLFSNAGHRKRGSGHKYAPYLMNGLACQCGIGHQPGQPRLFPFQTLTGS